MKKLIAILTSISITATSTSAVIACSDNQTSNNQDSQGRLILSSIEGLNTALGYIENPTEESVLTAFIIQNEAVLPEGTLVENFYILINGTTATINGTNDLAKNNTFSIEASSAVEVSFTVTAPNPSGEKIKLNSLSNLTLNLEAITNTSYATIRSKFFEINQAILPTGVSQNDFYIPSNSITDTSAIITGTNSSEYFTSDADDGVTVHFTIDTTNQFKISEAQGLETNMGAFDKSLSAAQLKPLLTAAFLDKNKTILPANTTTDALYIATAKIDTINLSAWVTGSFSQNVISSQEADGVEISFTLTTPIVDLSTLDLITTFKSESDSDADILSSFIKNNAQYNLDPSKLAIKHDNEIISIVSTDENVYTGEVIISVSLLLKLQDLGLNLELETLTSNSYLVILNQFITLNNDVLATNGITRDDLWINTTTITATQATIQANTNSQVLSQTSSIQVKFIINDTRIELDNTLNLKTALGELPSNAKSVIIQAFYNLNQDYFTKVNASITDFWISSSVGVTTTTSSTIQANAGSTIFKSTTGGLPVTFTLQTVEAGKVNLNEVEGVNFDLGEIKVPTSTSQGHLRPKNWKDIITPFLQQNKTIQQLSNRVVDDFANGTGTSFSYNNKTEDSKGMTITFQDKHQFFTGTIQIKYTLT